ncbi:MAG: D-alanine--D-alanine ligase [Micrococcales bacterium]|nr:D-alanine--D-alanine ligase [Micrococcales bacterium]
MQRVVLLFGGASSEHSISCATASGVLSAIDRTKYEVIPVGITRAGQFVPAVDDVNHWALTEGELPEVHFTGESIIWPTRGNRELKYSKTDGSTHSLGEIDVVFPVLHGPNGEDGTMQGFLELLDLPYVGNGVLASAAGIDKEFSKALFIAAGLPVTPHVVIHKEQWLSDPETVLENVKHLGGLPLFLEVAFNEDSKVTVEKGLVGREVECAVLSSRGGGAPQVSVAGEIVVKTREFYDFEAKYRDGEAAELICPAELSPDQLAEMQALARRAFNALGCFGLARADFFLTKDGFFVNELNLMPGFTPISMYPKCWQASGVSYPDLIDELIQLAFERN